MTKDDIVRVVVGVLVELQSNSGRPATSISENTRPIGDLDQFDSLNGVEATVELSDRLGIDVAGLNAFVNENGTKALTVSEIADAIYKLAAAKEMSE